LAENNGGQQAMKHCIERLPIFLVEPASEIAPSFAYFPAFSYLELNLGCRLILSKEVFKEPLTVNRQKGKRRE
jgi:hypothetical protein